MANLKRIFIGEPFPTSQESHERLDSFRALAVFASDPISSNAYATEAIMSILLLMGSGALGLTLPLALAVGGLVTIVALSYIQTILHYPKGGGSYIVAKDNLGKWPSLLAAAALLTDYILTVAVSVSAGIRALTSAFPELLPYHVLLAIGAIFLLTWLNLRGVRESGTIFAIPTYAFVGGVLVAILIGIGRTAGLFGLPPLPEHAIVVPAAGEFVGFAYVWLLLRAFAAGCTALTGIEAISDGVQAFKAPEAKNAAKTMIIMAVIAMSLFLGISYLANHMHLIPEESDSILSQMTREVSGQGFLYYWVQIFTMAILILAANTGFQDFPRLSYFLARDGFLPRWMMNRGDRLVFSGGVITLAVLSSVIVVLFRADEFAMLPLYALGVMISFTLSQSGMVHLMHRIGRLKPGESVDTDATTIHHEKGWQWKMVLNGFGATVTFIVLLILIATKFMDGAWIIVLTIPLIIMGFNAISKHYEHVASTLSTRTVDQQSASIVDIADIVIVPVGDIHKGTLTALQYAKKISNNVKAVCIVTSEDMQERIDRRWNRFGEITNDVELLCIEYDYRDITERLIQYIEHVSENEYPKQFTTVLIPQFVSKTLFENFMHNQTAQLIRSRLQQKEQIVMIDVPYHIE